MDTTTNRDEIDSIIRACDKAFVQPIVERKRYAELLLKIHQKGILVYAHNECVLGYCAFYANDSGTRKAYISLIAVRPEYHNQHIGRRILNSCMNTAVEYGMDSCVLEVRKNNRSAIRFYQANGFVFLSERETSFLMERELASQKGKTDEYQREKSNASCDGKAGLRDGSGDVQ